MTERWAQVSFSCKIKYLGFTARFYNEEAKLTKETEQIFKADPEKADIFINTIKNDRWTVAKIFGWYLQKQKKGVQDLVPDKISEKAFNTGSATFIHEATLGFDKGQFKMMTTEGLCDLKSVTIRVRYSVSPTAQ